MTMTSRKLFLAASVAALSVASVAAPIYTEAATKVFKDVPTSHVYYKEISEMTSKGIIHGYENGTFKPNELITRKHAAALLARAYPSSNKPSMNFKDMSNKNAYHGDMSLAISNGWLEAKDGKVRPDDTITRGEMARAISRAAKLPRSAGWNNTGLKDLSMEYIADIASLYHTGVTTGYEDKTFRENQGLSRAHYSVFMYRAMNYVADKQEAYKDSLYHESYIGKYQGKKVPNPTGVKGDHQIKEFEDLQKLMPKGSYSKMISFNSVERAETSIKGFSGITGSTEKEIMDHIDQAARTGKWQYFTGGNGTKYFIGFKYTGSSVMIGEDHR